MDYKKGFKIKLDSMECSVIFNTYNDKVVVCDLTVDDCFEIQARSKCNFKEGDKFDVVEGQKIALEKALCKLVKQAERIHKGIEREVARERRRIEAVRAGLIRKHLATLEKAKKPKPAKPISIS